MKVKTSYIILTLTVAVILGVSALLIGNLSPPIEALSTEDTGGVIIPPPKPGELDDYMTGEGKSWVAGEDPVPPLPEDTGGVIIPDGTQKTWGTLP